jgi:hypothetical protein
MYEMAVIHLERRNLTCKEAHFEFGGHLKLLSRLSGHETLPHCFTSNQTLAYLSSQLDGTGKTTSSFHESVGSGSVPCH